MRGGYRYLAGDHSDPVTSLASHPDPTVLDDGKVAPPVILLADGFYYKLHQFVLRKGRQSKEEDADWTAR